MVDKIEYIRESDVLNAGREKINKFAIDPAMRAESNSVDAKNIANQSNEISIDAKNIAENTNDRLDNIVASEMQDAEVIDARRPFGSGAYQTLGERLDSEKAEVTTQLAQTKNSIMNYGGNANAIDDNTGALNLAKQKGNVFFPQNSSKNAVYYFSGNPFGNDNLAEIKIYADEGVSLSISSMNGQALKKVSFMDKLNIIVRDRDNEAVQYKQTDDFTSTAMTENPINLGFKEPTLLRLGDGKLIERNLRTNGSEDVSSYFKTSSYYTYANGLVVNPFIKTENDMGLLHTLTVHSHPGYAFSCGFDSYSGQETVGDLRLGAVAYKDGSNFTLVSIDISKILYVGSINLDNGVSWSETSTDVSSLLPNTYTPNSDGFNLVIRQTKTREFEVYDNGFNLGKFKTPFDVNNIGAAINHLYVGLNSSMGIWNWAITNPMYEFLEEGYIGTNLEIGIWGDSLTESEGTSISWADYLGKYLNKQRGITSVKVDNFAVSGQKADQQDLSMSTNMKSSYTDVLILIGTNDIQAQTSIDTFKSTIESMIDKAKQYGAKVVIGIPPLFISRTLTGTGFASSNYEKGIAYRECIKVVAREKGVIIADVASELGRVGVNNHLDTLRDNLHPNTLTQISITKCFSRSIIHAHTSKVDLEDTIKSIVQLYK